MKLSKVEEKVKIKKLILKIINEDTKRDFETEISLMNKNRNLIDKRKKKNQIWFEGFRTIYKKKRGNNIMTNISHIELEKLSAVELENILFSCKTILNKKALEQFEIEKKSKQTLAFKNTMRYYKNISDNYAKNELLIGPYSWYFRTINHYEWADYQERFEQYIRSNYLEVEESVRPPYFDYFE